MNQATTDFTGLADWIGASERRCDRVTAPALAGLSATLDRTDPEPESGAEAPPLAHWLLFTPRARHSEIAADGHPVRGGFLPPVPLPRRMWAGGQLEFRHPLRVGDDLVRESRVANVDVKQGRSGALVFVAVSHTIGNAQGAAVIESQDIVYREAALAGSAQPEPTPARTDEGFRREMKPDPVLLFRYSALTFNSHRIHYDRSYATGAEGYPGLVVHGPLVATLLIDLLRRQFPQATVRRFEFKAVRPLFDIHGFTLCGRDDGDGCIALWARNHQGHLAMQASAEIC
jgi:3-methylfumaryl-CoA hydratase